MTSYRAEGIVTPHARDVGGAGRMRREFVAPGRLRVEIEYPAKTETRILNGERGWRGDRERVEPIQGPLLLAMRYQLLRLQPAWALASHRDRVTLRPAADGQASRTLRLTWSPELQVEYRVDAGTGRVSRAAGILVVGRMTMTLATEYSNFEAIDGVLVARTEETFAAGRHTATTRIDSIVFDADEVGPLGPTR